MMRCPICGHDMEYIGRAYIPAVGIGERVHRCPVCYYREALLEIPPPPPPALGRRLTERLAARVRRVLEVMGW